MRRSILNKRTLSRTVAAIAPFLVLGCAASDSSDSQAGSATIQLGQIELSFYAVTGGIVQELLEQDGYTVSVVEGTHSEIFPQLGNGEVDLLAATWLPNGHADLYEPVEDATFQVAPLYEDARFFWVVPSYVPEETISAVSDLAQKDVQERLPEQIVSLPEETGLTVASRRVLDEYDLDEAGYELVAASSSEWIDSFQSAFEAKEWVVFPLWQPQWINAAYDIRRLEEPLDAYGEPDTAYLLGHNDLRDKLSPDALERLSNVRLSVDAVTEMDRLVNEENLTPLEAARTWLDKNQEIAESWGYLQ